MNVKPPGVSRLGQQLLGLLRVVRERLDPGVHPEVARVERYRAPPRVAAQEVLDDGVPVDRVVDRLPHLPVLDRALRPRVELVVGDDHPVRRLADHGVGAPGHALHLVGRDVLDDVRLAVQQGRDPGGGFRDEAERDALDLGLPPPVVRVGLERDPVPLHPLDELERAGPDRVRGEVVPLLLDVLRRQHDDAPAARVGHPGEEHRERPLAHDVDGVLVDDLDLLHRGQRRLGAGLRVVQLALDAELDGLGVEGLPVVELHAAAELELVGGGTDEPPGLGEAAGEAHALVTHQERVEDVPGDVVGGDLPRQVGVERRRLGGQSDRQPRSLLGLGALEQPQAEQKDEPEQPGSGEHSRASHQCLLAIITSRFFASSSRGRL